MAIWAIDDHSQPDFDDGLTLKPGEDGFDAGRTAAQQHFATTKVSYKGTPNWQPPADPAPPAAPAP